MSIYFTQHIKAAEGFNFSQIPGIHEDGSIDAYKFFTSEEFKRVKLPDGLNPDNPNDAEAITRYALGVSIDYLGKDKGFIIPSNFEDGGALFFWGNKCQGVFNTVLTLAEMFPDVVFYGGNYVDGNYSVNIEVFENGEMNCKKTKLIDVFKQNISEEDQPLIAEFNEAWDSIKNSY